MISNSMLHYIARLTCHASCDSLVRSITDWIILGCYTSFHKSQWCSIYHSIFKTIDGPQWYVDVTVLPIISHDFSFMTESSHCLLNIHSTHDNNIGFTMLCIHRQRTMTTGKNLHQHRADSNWMCPTQPASTSYAKPPTL